MATSDRGVWAQRIRGAALAIVTIAVVAWSTLARAQPVAPDPAEGRALLAAANTVGRFRLQTNGREGYALQLLDGGDQPMGVVNVYRRPGTFQARFQSRHFSYDVWNSAPDHAVVETLIRATHAVAAADGGGAPGRTRPRDRDTGTVVQIAAVVGALALAVAVLRRGRLILDLRTPHVIQVATQASIYLYWMVYFPGIRHQLPMVAAQLALGFAADALCCFARFRSWRVGLSPVPVILSINLFEWFDPLGATISIVVAFASKAFVHRGDRHIFNPSVAGLTVVGILTMVAPGVVHFGSAFHTLNIAPSMAEWILLVAFIGQMRFRISPVSIAALIALQLADNPAALRPSIIIAVTLLASDPATTPRSDLGKMMFGAVVGFGLPALSVLMRVLGQPDDFAKVMSVAVANALSPALDALAGMVTAGLASFRADANSVIGRRWTALAPRVSSLAAMTRRPLPNLAFVACWLLLAAGWLREEKPYDFEPALHWNNGTPLVVRDADDVPRCAHNPVFCRPFRLPQEAALWWRRLR